VNTWLGLSLLVFLLLINAPKLCAVSCDELTGDLVSVHFAFNEKGVLVTDSPLALIESNLRIRAGHYDGKDVLSLGEGVSGLLPALVEAGANPMALDTWYFSDKFPQTEFGREMQAYQTRNAKYLVRGDANNFPSNPKLAGKKFDLIVSHKLVNNLTTPEAAYLIANVAQSLKAGGEGRLYGYTEQQLNDIIFPSVIPQLLKHGIKIDVEAFVSPTETGNANRLLVIRRH
jgi:hypothetical protein